MVFLNFLRPAFLFSFLPVILFTLSFIFSILSITTKDWSHRLEKNPNNASEIIGINHRSPFFKCTLVPHYINRDGKRLPTNSSGGAGNEPFNTIFTEECTRASSPRDVCRGEQQIGPDNVTFCQQLVLTGKLLIASATLLCLAALATILLFSFTIAGIYKTGYILLNRGSQPHSSNHPHVRRFAIQNLVAYLTLLLVGFGVGGVGSLAAAQFIGGNVLVNVGSVWEVFYSPADQGIVLANGPWNSGKGISFAAAGWILGAFGLGLVPLVWELPKVGVKELEEP